MSALIMSEQTIVKVSSDVLRCSNCDFSWCMKVTPAGDILRLLKNTKLCPFCYSYKRKLSDLSPVSSYNPYDLSQWIARLVRKEFFYCCVCKTNLLAKHRLSEYPYSSVKIFSFRPHPLHSFCRPCFVWAITTLKSHIVPEFCCFPRPSVKIVEKSYRLVIPKPRG